MTQYQKDGRKTVTDVKVRAEKNPYSQRFLNVINDTRGEKGMLVIYVAKINWFYEYVL